MSDPLRDSARYLERLGFDRPPPPTLASLRLLQQRHTEAFPFETIASLLHAPVPIDLPSLQCKLLHEGRGGYCYELNRLFLALLQQSGFDAHALSGRVVMGESAGVLTARTHLMSRVHIEGVDYLADVGFGGMVPTAPLRMDTEDAQATPHEACRLLHDGGDYLLQAQVAGEWRSLYAFDLQPQGEIDHVVGNWYVSTHPDSPFRGQLFVARTGHGLRRTLNGGRYTIHRTGAASEHHVLRDVEAVIGVLEDDFGLRLPVHPGLHAAMARLLESAPLAA